MNTMTEEKIRLHDTNGDLIDPETCFTGSKLIDENFRAFIMECCKQYGRGSKLKEADAIGKIMYKLLSDKGYAGEGVQHQIFVDVLLGAALTHNMFYEPDKISTLFLAREKFEEIAENMENPVQYELCDAMYQAIEGQEGDRSAILGVKPNPNTPPELLAQAKYVYNCLATYTLD